MKYKNYSKIGVLLLTLLFVLTNVIIIQSAEIKNIDAKSYDFQLKNRNLMQLSNNNEDIDPLIDLDLTVTIKEIRAFDNFDKRTDPDFYVKVYINDEVFKSPIWRNQKYLYDLDWSCTADVPDEEEFVNVTIELWEWNLGFDTLCDIAPNDNWNPDRNKLELFYNLKSGHWMGDDFVYIPHSWSMDLSGYGRGNGCDDNTIYIHDNDCEIWFDITQNDYDDDGIPYWTETEIFNTDPTIDDSGRDDDGDGIPIFWEYKWGHSLDWYYDEETDQWQQTHIWFYDPFIWDDHENIDPDNDGLNNYQEYLTSQWGSDPFCDDLFVELDQMEEGPNRERASILPEGSKNLIRDAFGRQNVRFFLDDGKWENTGSEIIPFDELSSYNDLHNLYNRYFLHYDNDNWRKGVFHYGLVVYEAEGAGGYVFRGDSYQISTTRMEKSVINPLCGNRDVVYASAYMHELGHTLGLVYLGGHSTDAYYPWQPLWWKFRPYKSVMNYGYMYGFIHNLVDYSDGTRGKNDYDDWSNLDLYYFKA
jgi:hypothetical protein